MKYRDSQDDKSLRKWFLNDNSQVMLRNIKLLEGKFRGLTSLDIRFDFPITAIAGKNGAGKSTILALAACAYHNEKNGFKLARRNNPYYTFSDFFIQHTHELSPQGIKIAYEFAYNNWKRSAKFPDGVGLGMQIRKKKNGGKWNDYDSRLKKAVVFLGIDRIVPHSERSQSKSYAKSFIASNLKGWEEKVKEIVGYILGKTYDEFRYLEYSKYNLPLVKFNEVTYSGFNMGAGENALFEIFSTIYSCGKGFLLVLDEIELGLHCEAQRRFIEKLKIVCLETKTQVICTTHSKDIFDSLPDDARYFIEQVNGKTKLTSSISSEFAFAKLGAAKGKELDIYVEDEVAKSILLAVLPSIMRSRLTIHIIGSASAISRQLAAHYIKAADRPIIAIFDADQRAKESQNLAHAKNMAENPGQDFEQWFKSKVIYLPGEIWPEAWIINRFLEKPEPLAAALNLETDTLIDYLNYGLQAGKHDEFHEISQHLGLEKGHCLSIFSQTICSTFSQEFVLIVEKVSDELS